MGRGGRTTGPDAAAKRILTECVPWVEETHVYTHQKEAPLCRRKEVVLPVPHGEKREMFCCLGPGRNAGPSAAAKGILKRSKSLERMGAESAVILWKRKGPSRLA